MAKPAWTLEAARDALLVAGYEIGEVLPIPHGHQIRCVGGQMVSVYARGSFLAQGREATAVKALLDAGPGLGTRPPEVRAIAARPVGTTTRLVTDYPSTRTEDAGIAPPW